MYIYYLYSKVNAKAYIHAKQHGTTSLEGAIDRNLTKCDTGKPENSQTN